MTQEDAVALANEIERVEAALKQMKEQLKLFVQVNGPVCDGDQIWDMYPSVKWTFSSEKKRELAMMLAIEGADPWDYLELGSKQVKKIKDKLGWQDQHFLQYGINSTSNSFRSKKVDKE